MLVALYIGDHAKDGIMTRIGCWLTRLAQKGPFDQVTHIEAIHDEHPDGSVTISSASLRDGGVRSKQVTLDAAHWLIVDMSQWNVVDSKELLLKTDGQPYNWRGALALFLPGSPISGTWFCNQWVSEPYLLASETFSPAQLAAIVISQGEEITSEFFASRQLKL